MSGLAEIWALSRQPSWRLWAAAAILGRLLSTMVVLAYVLVGEAVYGSIAVGALLAGTATFSAGLAAPSLGRRLDRHGLHTGLVTSLWVTAAVMILQIPVVVTAGPQWVCSSWPPCRASPTAPSPVRTAPCWWRRWTRGICRVRTPWTRC